MSDVYFSKEIDRILDKIDFSKLGKKVAIKVHFGEKGCVTYISPEFVKKVYDKVISTGRSATLVECNVLYKGSRTNTTDHIKTAKEHGFTFAPIEILDGELGDEETDVKVDGIAKIAKLGAGIKKYDSMIVLTHFKGHIDAGYGGAFKNIGMGLANRSGKLSIHANTKPFINPKKCTACKNCINHCNFNAISIVDGKAKIDPQKCSGCAMCIAVCNNSAVNVPWGSSSHEEVQKKVVDYSKGVLEIIPNTIFINFLINITKDCDCFGIIQKPIIPDVGILYSKDIVAIDKSSLDLVNKKSNNKFDKINNIDKNRMIDYAFSRKLGNRDYKLIDLDR
ncbi:CoB--CoM heterodisulfide reductase iron-sulfur subunit A [uncultured archaeon]|nr:CoB--CoM heterodisulfide reductase iron-sulfur subunit A [uncultured archaeon]